MLGHARHRRRLLGIEGPVHALAVDQAEMHMGAIADAGGRGLRREARTKATTARRFANDLARDDGTVGARHAHGRSAGDLILADAIFGFDRLEADIGGEQSASEIGRERRHHAHLLHREGHDPGKIIAAEQELMLEG
jgi:hypothetical protein